MAGLEGIGSGQASVQRRDEGAVFRTSSTAGAGPAQDGQQGNKKKKRRGGRRSKKKTPVSTEPSI